MHTLNIQHASKQMEKSKLTANTAAGLASQRDPGFTSLLLFLISQMIFTDAKNLTDLKIHSITRSANMQTTPGSFAFFTHTDTPPLKEKANLFPN